MRRTVRIVVLDIDETLIHANIRQDNPGKPLVSHSPEFWKLPPDIRGRVVTIDHPAIQIEYIARPYVHKFIDTCYEIFDYVVIWSAGTKDYVKIMVDSLFNYRHHYPDLLMNRDHTVPLPNNSYHKPLSLVVDLMKKEGMISNDDEVSIVIIDDRRSNFISNPESGIHIKEYRPVANPQQLSSDSDNTLYLLAEYLKSSDGDFESVVDRTTVF